jgi:hypothetical protein
MSYEIQNIVSQCFNSLQIKHIQELNEVTSNTYPNMTYVIYNALYVET